MFVKFQNKYRIPSARWQKWDYSWVGAYFITICTKNHNRNFGNIINGEMLLLGTGILADVFWHEIKNHAKNVELGEFVVMPNHVHGILVLNGNDNDDNVGDNMGDNVQTGYALSVKQQQQPNTPSIGQQRFQNIGNNSVSAIIGSYKSAVTKHAHRLGMQFVWQERFHDHVIRNTEEFQRISEYIKNNPRNWESDKFHKK